MYDRRPGFFRTEEHQTAARRVEAKVKWFDPAKGFGFVTPDDGGADAFLPMAILRRAGIDFIREGASLTCMIGVGAKGPLVVDVLHLERGPAAGAAREAAPVHAARTLTGMVRWFEPGKGFGFIAPDGGGKDVFVHAAALKRGGVAALAPGQRVRMEVVQGRKGLEAERIAVI